MLRLRLGFGVMLIIAIVRIFLSYGAASGIKGMNADSKTVIKETTGILVQNPRNYDAYTRRGYAHFTLFQPKDAIQDYTAAIGILPSAELYKKRADAYALDGKDDLAEKDRVSASKYH